jgi:hypothetical protein
MDNERPIQETIARCVSIMVAYHNSGPTEGAAREMRAEIRAVAEAARTFSLGIQETVEKILRPVESELFARYGHELGSRMNAQFQMAFEARRAPGQHPHESQSGVPDLKRGRTPRPIDPSPAAGK